MALKQLVFDNYRMGMNNRESARSFNKLVDDTGHYQGPMPLLRNVDRSEGVLKPRGTADKFMPVAVPAAITGMALVGAIEDDNRQPDAFENLFIAYADGTTGSYIGRANPDATGTGGLLLSKALDVCGYITGAGTVHFINLKNYVVAYNGTEAVVIDCFNDFISGVTWTVTGATVTVGGAAWLGISQNWIGKYVTFKRASNSAWYGSYKILAVSYDVTGGNTITLDASTGLTAAALNSVTIIGPRNLLIPAPTRTPLLENEYFASGNLSGTYQYAFSFVTSDGFEGPLGPWSLMKSLQGKQMMIYNLPTAPISGETWHLNNNIDRVNIWRKGGTMGASPARVGTVYIAGRYHGAGDVCYAQVSDGGGAYGTTVPGRGGSLAVHTGEATIWEDYGVLGIVQSGYMTEMICYSAHASATFTLNNSQRTGNSYNTGNWVARNYGGTVVGGAQHTGVNINDHDYLCQASFMDNVADSELIFDIPPLDRNDTTPIKVCGGCTTGNRLCLIDIDKPARVHISAADSWRSFRDPDATTTVYTDYTDANTGGPVDVGTAEFPIKALVVFQPGTVLAFKEEEAYLVSGTNLWTIQMLKLQNIEGCTAPDGFVMADNYLLWAAGSQIWLWDGAENLINLSQFITDLKDNTLVYMDEIKMYYYDNRVFIHYTVSGDTLKNSRYVELDFRYPAITQTNRTIPSPSIGDHVEAQHVAVSRLHPDKNVIYAARTDRYIYRIFGTGATRYPTETNDAVVEVETPDVVMFRGIKDAVFQKYAILMYSLDSSLAPTVTFTPRVNSVDGTPVVKTPHTTAANICTVYDRLASSVRGGFLGCKVSIPLVEMHVANTDDKVLTIESIIFEFSEGRKVPTE
jgi:hypothetical protein